MTRGYCGAIGTGQPWRVKTQALAAMPRGGTNPEKGLAACNEGDEQVFAARAHFLRDGERCGKERCAGMHACAWMAQAVLLEGVRERTVGKRRKRGVKTHAGSSEQGARSASPVPFG